MRKLTGIYQSPPELLLGSRLNRRVPEQDQRRQRTETEEILRRLCAQPGVILADEVGMGKTYVALAVAYSVAVKSPQGPVLVMVPANLIDKWEQDLRSFCELYLENRRPACKGREVFSGSVFRYGIARDSVELMKLLDDHADQRCQLVFLAQGAMARRQTDRWIRLALIAEALRRHGRGKANRLIQVKKQIHRFLAELMQSIGQERTFADGPEMWKRLLQADPSAWMDIYNGAIRDGACRMDDHPVPTAVIRSLGRIELGKLAEALKEMPVRACGGTDRISERLNDVRHALRVVEDNLWKVLLAQARWRSPLLVVDEAHHLKNPETSLARQLQSPDSDGDLRTGDGAMAHTFDRMLFLTATPFQLGHHELVNVLKRFGDVRWDENRLGQVNEFCSRLENLGRDLTESQRASIALQRSWSRLRPEDCRNEADGWWCQILGTARESLTGHQRSVVDAYKTAKRCRDVATEALRPWIVRHNKGTEWVDTSIRRRQRFDGAAIVNSAAKGGISIPPRQLLPFFLAARSSVSAGQDLLGEALCSSYEAFRLTRQNRETYKDSEDAPVSPTVSLSHADWYPGEFDHALQKCSGAMHPKMDATVRKVVDLWEQGEKVLVFAFYRHTCRALRVHIGREIERRSESTGLRRLREAGCRRDGESLTRLIAKIQERYFDKPDTQGRRALDDALTGMLHAFAGPASAPQIDTELCGQSVEVMRRFLRVPTTLVRCFPLAELDSIEPHEAIKRMLAYTDVSGFSWRRKFKDFLTFLIDRCSADERRLYLEAGQMTKTGRIRVDWEDDTEEDANLRTATVANVQTVTGTTKRDTRARLMRAFNTPFFPDILVCSQVMGEGVDLQRYCRHVVHHDLDWNPSMIEQRTGRIDRLGCKAEGVQPIAIYLPYLAGASDERQYHVMSERERWFRVVMGQDEVANLITPDSSPMIPLPAEISDELSYRLDLNGDQ